jgi:hypothetical protein
LPHFNKQAGVNYYPCYSKGIIMFEPKCTYSVFALCDENPETTYHESCGYESFKDAQEEVKRLSNQGYLVKLYIFKPVVVSTTQPVEEDDEDELTDVDETEHWEEYYPQSHEAYFY